MIERFRELGHAVLLDLSEVTFIDSTGLSALMDAHFASERNGWDFGVRHPSPAVRRVVELAGVERVLGE
jgi:anti-sigma B factor antagonist